ncbi:hypothetical protein OTSSIDO_0142 [Orientia tsutsugamushi str. Sido]|nr:hypothetical protein OTSSIDO_0142 [Orientia tsutsugamushi str. Sido]
MSIKLQPVKGSKDLLPEEFGNMITLLVFLGI